MRKARDRSSQCPESAFFYRHKLFRVIILFLDIDDCVNSPCQNGGSCIDGVSSFLCLCGPGFTGELCQSGSLMTLCSSQ